jgi:hypothetical protein
MRTHVFTNAASAPAELLDGLVGDVVELTGLSVYIYVCCYTAAHKAVQELTKKKNLVR